MKTIVLVKQVPECSEAKLERRGLALIRGSVEGAMNPADRGALEVALRLRGSHGGEVVALSMGPQEADHALREALAMGADEAALVSDAALAGSDAYATALALARACGRLGPFDLVLAGSRTADGSGAQVGPRMAAELGIPHVGEATQVETEDGRRLVVTRRWQGRLAKLKAPLPALVSIAVGAVKPRYPSASALVAACRREVRRLTLEDLGLDAGDGGQARVRVERVQAVEERRERATLRGSAEQVAGELARLLESGRGGGPP